MHIENIEKIKELIKAKLPDYVKELGLKTNGNKIQCPNHGVHENSDLKKMSAAFLPESGNTTIYCFVENRLFDIFDIYGINEKKPIVGNHFFDVVIALAKKYNIPVTLKDEHSPQEQLKNKQRKYLQELHEFCITQAKFGTEYYKKRKLKLAQVKYFGIGFITPQKLPDKFKKECKNLFGFRIEGLLEHPALVIPLYNRWNQYTGLNLRQFGETDTPYIRLMVGAKNLFNMNNIRGDKEITISEGVFDVIAQFPTPNVVGCLTNTLDDRDVEFLAQQKFKHINLALDPDNYYKGKARDGILRTILKLKDLDSIIKVTMMPTDNCSEKTDPDSYIKEHGIEEFSNLPKIHAIEYLLNCYEKGLIPLENIYEFVSGCPNIIRKEEYINILSKKLKVGKKQLSQTISSVEKKSSNINIIQYIEEKESAQELFEEFTDFAWNNDYKAIPSGLDIFDTTFGGFEDTLYTFIGFPEQGKCLRKDTPIVMYDGSIKLSQDIKVGDVLMGDANNPVKVVSTTTGTEQMYEIIPNKLDPWGCNKSHILVLAYKVSGYPEKIYEMSVKEFLEKSKSFQEHCKLMTTSVKFKEKVTIIDPYFLGLWLGDGNFAAPIITKDEPELDDYFLNELHLKQNIKYRKRINKNRCPSYIFTHNRDIIREINKCKVDNEKRIPQSYLINSEEKRLKLLAGLLDTDGYLTKDNVFEIITKYSGLCKDILFLARSLGFRAVENKKKIVKGKEYHRILITGELNTIPTKLKRKQGRAWKSHKSYNRYGFKIVKKDVGKYYGFTLDKKSNGRFLLGDFTVTHNTTVLLNFIYNLLKNENNFVSFYSLDDGAKRSIIPRLLGIISGLRPSMFRNPTEENKTAWFSAMQQLMSFKDRCVIKDGSQITTVEDLEKYVKIHYNIATERGKKLFIIIDNLHDIVASHKFESVQNTQRVASFLKRLPQRLSCPVIATAEVPKSSNDKPTGKNIKESIDLWYASRFVGGIYSNFHNKGDDEARNNIYSWQAPDGSFNPIVEMLVSKNQTGDATHASVFFKLNLKTNKLISCTPKECEMLRNGQFISFNQFM